MSEVCGLAGVDGVAGANGERALPGSGKPGQVAVFRRGALVVEVVGGVAAAVAAGLVLVLLLKRKRSVS